MEKVLKDVSFLIFLLKMCFIFGQETSVEKRILIDVGHGGNDSGAIGMHGIQEKDIVLDIAMEILSQNKQSENPLDIYLTRYSDTFISLSDRTKLAKALKVDVFISLHCNHSDNPNARGIEVYVVDSESKYSDDSTWFAYRIQEGFRRQLGFESRGVKFANFQVLREASNSYPALLIEMGFLSNRDESFYLEKHETLRPMALIIIMGLYNYLNARL